MKCPRCGHQAITRIGNMVVADTSCAKCGLDLTQSPKLDSLRASSQLVFAYIAGAKKYGCDKSEGELIKEASAYVASLEIPYAEPITKINPGG
jgi:transcription elongation factor Elf1